MFVSIVLLFLAVSFLTVRLLARRSAAVPVSVNYHFTRKCNKVCGFCFHTDTTSHIEAQDRAKQGLALLRRAGMRKINFAGGEPFLYPAFLSAMLIHCKETLRLGSVSIVTNGSLVTEKFLSKHARYIDILAVSCDSFDEQVNIDIGRGDGDNVHQLHTIAAWCRRWNIQFKINTVVNQLNWREEMHDQISRLRPFRWKCFQVLIVQGENDSDSRRRNAHRFIISDEEFEAFCERHKNQKCLVPEPNRLMATSYLILDEHLRFLDRTGRQPSRSILEVGVARALASVFWDESAFIERGGLYDWGRETVSAGCGQDKARELEW